MLNTFFKCLVKENSEQRRKRKNKLPDDPKIPPPGRRDCTSKRHMHPMLTAALFTTVKTWKQRVYSLTDERVKTTRCIYTTEHYSDMKKNRIMPCAGT